METTTTCAYCGATKEGLSFCIGASSKADWTMVEGTGKLTCPACYEKAMSEGRAAIDKHVRDYNKEAGKYEHNGDDKLVSITESTEGAEHTPGPIVRAECGAFEKSIWLASKHVAPDPVTKARFLYVAKVLPTKSENPCWRQEEEREANAARIIKSWNCHDDLLSALNRLLAAFETDARISPDMPVKMSIETEVLKRVQKGNKHDTIQKTSA